MSVSFGRKAQYRFLAVAVVSLAISFEIARECSIANGGTLPQERAAEDVYKNIQVFKGVSSSELNGAMYFMSGALGVGCAYCHTSSWESDAKPAKIAARRMIRMTETVNKENFSGNPTVNCFTCHRGRPQTATLLPVEEAPAVAKPEVPPAGEAIPSAQVLVNRYLQAIGADNELDWLTSRVSKGTLTTTDGSGSTATLSLEVYQSAPNRLLVVMSRGNRKSYEGFDGHTAWASDNQARREITPEQIARLRHDAEFFRYLKLARSYPTSRVLGREQVAGVEAYAVGAVSSDGTREKLYFDAKSGLLVRRYVLFKTVLGTIPETIDFADYRRTGRGRLMLPFTIRWSRAPFSETSSFTEIRINAPIDSARFQPPG